MKSIVLMHLVFLLVMGSIGLPTAYFAQKDDYCIISIDYNSSQNYSTELTHPTRSDIKFVNVDKDSNLDGVHTLILRYKTKSTIMYNSKVRIGEYLKSIGLRENLDYTIIETSTIGT